jgi:Fe2+ transport system protein B
MTLTTEPLTAEEEVLALRAQMRVDREKMRTAENAALTHKRSELFWVNYGREMEDLVGRIEEMTDTGDYSRLKAILKAFHSRTRKGLAEKEHEALRSFYDAYTDKGPNRDLHLRMAVREVEEIIQQQREEVKW